MFLERRLDVRLGLGCHPEEFDLYSFFQYKVVEGVREFLHVHQTQFRMIV